MPSKKASSQAAWALLANNIAQARVEAHRLRHTRNRMMGILKHHSDPDHVWQNAGDIILGSQRRLDSLDAALDKLGYVISSMGKEFLRNRMPIEDREEVDASLEGTPVFDPGSLKAASPLRVASSFLAIKADKEGWK